MYSCKWMHHQYINNENTIYDRLKKIFKQKQYYLLLFYYTLMPIVFVAFLFRCRHVAADHRHQPFDQYEYIKHNIIFSLAIYTSLI